MTLPSYFQGVRIPQPLYLRAQFREDRCMQFRVIVVTDPPTHKHAHRQDRLQYINYDMFDSHSTAVRPRYDHSTSRPT